MNDNTASKEVNSYLQNLEDTGFFKEDTAQHAKLPMAAHEYLTLNLPNGIEAQVVSLANAGMTALEYVEHIFKNGDKPTAIAMNNTNGKLLIEGIEDMPNKRDTELDTPAVMSALSGTRISFNDMIGNDHIVIYRKPATQSVGGSIMEEMHKLFSEVK